MSELGQTSDPTSLVPGSPPALERANRGYLDWATTLRRAAVTLAAIRPANWTGTGADRFTAALTRDTKALQTMASACESTALACDQTGQTTTWAQGQAREAIALWNATPTGPASRPFLGDPDNDNPDNPDRTGNAGTDTDDQERTARIKAQWLLHRARVQLLDVRRDAAHTVTTQPAIPLPAQHRSSAPHPRTPRPTTPNRDTKTPSSTPTHSTSTHRAPSPPTPPPPTPPPNPPAPTHSAAAPSTPRHSQLPHPPAPHPDPPPTPGGPLSAAVPPTPWNGQLPSPTTHAASATPPTPAPPSPSGTDDAPPAQSGHHHNATGGGSDDGSNNGGANHGGANHGGANHGGANHGGANHGGANGEGGSPVSQWVSGLDAHDPRRVRHIVVAPPRHGHHDTLWDIAERTTGDGRRWREIQRLNQGLPQPDGRHLDRPALVRPGWVLAVPTTLASAGPDTGGLDTPGPLTGCASAAPAPPSVFSSGPAQVADDGRGNFWPTAAAIGVGTAAAGAGVALVAAGSRGPRPTAPTSGATAPTEHDLEPDPILRPGGAPPTSTQRQQPAQPWREQRPTRPWWQDQHNAPPRPGPHDEAPSTAGPLITPQPGQPAHPGPARPGSGHAFEPAEPTPTTAPPSPRAGTATHTERPTERPEPESRGQNSDGGTTGTNQDWTHRPGLITASLEPNRTNPDAEPPSGHPAESWPESSLPAGQGSTGGPTGLQSTSDPGRLLVPIGVRGCQVRTLDLTAQQGFGLVGPGAQPAARALLAMLADPELDPASAPLIWLAAPTAHTLLGTEHPPLPGWVRANRDLGHCLDELETLAWTRAREHAEGPDLAHTPLLLFTEPDPDQLPRLRRLLASGAGLGIAAIVLGEWPTGTTCQLAIDATITHATSTADTAAQPHELLTTRLWTLTHTELLERLTTNPDHTTGHDQDEPDGDTLDDQDDQDLAPIGPHDEVDAAGPDRITAAGGTGEVWHDDPRSDDSGEDQHPQLGVAGREPAPAPPSGGDREADAADESGEPADDHRDDRWREEVPAEALLVIRCLGRPSVLARVEPGAPLIEITEHLMPKQRLMQAALASRRDGIPIDELLEAGWPDSPLANAKRNLHSTLTQLRRVWKQATGQDGGAFAVLIDGRYHLADPHPRTTATPPAEVGPVVWVDYWAFEQALETARTTTGPTRWAALHRAASLYRGPLWDEGGGGDIRWLESARHHARAEVIDALGQLAEHTRDTDPDQAAALLDTAVEHDPTDQPTAAALIRLHHQRGRTGAAHRVYTRLAAALTDAGLPGPDRATTTAVHDATTPPAP